MRVGAVTPFDIMVANLSLRRLNVPDNHHASDLKQVVKYDLIRKLNRNQFGLTDFDYSMKDLKNNKMIFTQRF